ncbi:MAG: SDR family oxidoreductase [Acidobacteria bacterium]|nr:SDR family oxidoreductase [Acidobacteriota bacterium]
MATVFITGAAGFLGSHLTDRFIAEGWRVVALDSFLTGAPENLAHLAGHDRFRFIRYDVTQYLFVAEPLDLILHFACPASPSDYLAYPIHTMKVDSIGTLHSLGLAKAKRARYLLASTSEVYGDPEVHPQPESYWGRVNPIGPRSVYDEAKRFSEALTMAYHHAHKLDTRIARIFNVYGPRMRVQDGRAVPNFMTQALRGEPITVYGDGQQTRSLCFVSDLVEGVFRLATSEGLSGEVVNIGNPEEHTMEGLARMIAEITSSQSPIQFRELPLDDPRRRRPEIEKARRLLNWEPVMPLAEGLCLTADYFRMKLSGDSRVQ